MLWRYVELDRPTSHNPVPPDLGGFNVHWSKTPPFVCHPGMSHARPRIGKSGGLSCHANCPAAHRDPVCVCVCCEGCRCMQLTRLPPSSLLGWGMRKQTHAPIRYTGVGDHECEGHLDQRRDTPPKPQHRLLGHNERISATPGPSRKLLPVVVNSGVVGRVIQTVYPALCLCIPCWHATDHGRN